MPPLRLSPSPARPLEESDRRLLLLCVSPQQQETVRSSRACGGGTGLFGTHKTRGLALPGLPAPARPNQVELRRTSRCSSIHKEVGGSPRPALGRVRRINYDVEERKGGTSRKGFLWASAALQEHSPKRCCRADEPDSLSCVRWSGKGRSLGLVRRAGQSKPGGRLVLVSYPSWHARAGS